MDGSFDRGHPPGPGRGPGDPGVVSLQSVAWADGVYSCSLGKSVFIGTT
ncbi:MAG: hypothetical protein ACYTGN_18885 [Planctomycetota bacterium]